MMKKTIFNILGFFENILRWCLPLLLIALVLGLVSMSLPQLRTINYAENVTTIIVIVGIFVAFFVLFFAFNKKASVSNVPSNARSIFTYRQPDYAKAFPFPLLGTLIILIAISIIGTSLSASLMR